MNVTQNAASGSLRRLRGVDFLLLASLVVVGAVVLVAALWFRQTSDICACYKAYHRAKEEFRLAGVRAADVCMASRRCCVAQCNLLLADEEAACDAHLHRLQALAEQQPPSRPGGEADADRAIWQAYLDEANLWVREGGAP